MLIRTPFALVLLASLTPAQLREDGLPASLRGTLPTDVPTVVLRDPNVLELRRFERERAEGRFRYGIEIDLDRSCEEIGRWDVVPETGEVVWRVELAAPGAKSLGVVFSRFDLPVGGQLFLYDPSGRDLLGAYGESTENPNGMLAIQPLRGDRAVLEYVEPPGAATRAALHIGTVVHDRIDVLAHLADGGMFEAGCLVDVNCTQGANYQDVKRAVVWMFGGGGGCSASILNNTAENGIPYLYTAEHCGNQTNAVFVFDYERTGCGTGSSSQSKSLSGSTQLAVTSLYDGQLYRLNQNIPASYEPFYAGWSTALDVTRGVGISHPSGFPKKISIDNQPPLQVGTRWSVQWNVGAIQPGSSGSPLFDQRKRVIGALSTGSGSCSLNGNYGLFHQFYATKNLAQWLNPEGWHVLGIDGFDGIEPYAKSYAGLGTNPELLSSVNLPRLGTTWTARVTTAAYPAETHVQLIAFDRPHDDGFASPYGTILTDPSSPQLLIWVRSVAAGTDFSFALPSSVSLVGKVGYFQAFLLGSTVATNGLKAELQF
jgi:hypothetical protein